jgi:hypothetical protein
MSFWVVSFGGEEWISCFHKEDKQTNKPKICCRDTQLSFKKEGEQEQEFFGLEIRFCEFSGFVGEGVDVAVVLLTVMVCG